MFVCMYACVFCVHVLENAYLDMAIHLCMCVCMYVYDGYVQLLTELVNPEISIQFMYNVQYVMINRFKNSRSCEGSG